MGQHGKSLGWCALAGLAGPVLTETRKGLGQEPTDDVTAARESVPAGEVAVFTYLRDPA